MSARKLQQEFDKTNKKIAEGLSAFDDIHDKLVTTEIASQRDKLESDLKKEIKKLQRSRDQLKQWLGDGSIKLDKNLLQENRTRIEHAMDQFKDLEKSSKIKQFSNEGLEMKSQGFKFNRFSGDPADVKRLEAYNYINEVIEQINQQNEGLESEIDQLSTQSRRSKSSSSQSQIDDLKYKQERNGKHLTQLEKISRNLENGKLDPEKVEDIKDDIEYYVENNQDEDYVEYDDFYDQLQMDDESAETEEVVAGVLTGELDAAEPENDHASSDQPQSYSQTSTSSVAPPAPGPSSAPVTSAPQDKSTPVMKKSRPTVVPAPNPSPLTNANSYSNVIKAAANGSTSSNNKTNNNLPTVDAAATAAATAAKNATKSTAASTKAASSTTTTGTSSAKVPPPGLNNNSRSRTASPQVANSKLHQNSQSPRATDSSNQGDAEAQRRNQSPTADTTTEIKSDDINGKDKTFWETIPRLSTIPQSRLHNPLPFKNISGMLENSLLNCPDSFDAEKPRQYTPLNVHPSSVDYPQEPMYELNSTHVMKKFDNDTLFYCFYYSEGIYNLARWNAAKELSNRGWVWNKDTKQWFAKDVQSLGGKLNRSLSVVQKEDTEEASGDGVLSRPGSGLHDDQSIEQPEENGKVKEENYKYFDYERTWLIRRRENFLFAPEVRQTF